MPDAYRPSPDTKASSGPTSRWTKTWARMRTHGHPAHAAPLGVGVLLSTSDVPWWGFLIAFLVLTVVGSIVFCLATERSEGHLRKGAIAMIFWGGILALMGAFFGTTT